MIDKIIIIFFLIFLRIFVFRELCVNQRIKYILFFVLKFRLFIMESIACLLEQYSEVSGKFFNALDDPIENI